MLIAVVSDTHNMKKYIDIAKKHISSADVVIHLGDDSGDLEEITREFNGEVYAVRGNCDASAKYPKQQLIEIAGKKIFFTHGDLYGVKMGYNNIYFKGKELEADIVLFGHTHEAIIEKNDGLILMNPGSMALPKLRGRYVGFIELEDNKLPNCYLKEVEVV